jgi:hypothetical protein
VARYATGSRPDRYLCIVAIARGASARPDRLFAVNAFAEASQVELLKGKLTQSMLPSASGKGQVFWPCADCGVTVWSNYPQAGQNIHFIRVGTLDDPSRAPPDIHIYTSTKQPWVVLPDGVPAVAEFYRAADHWPAESTARFKAERASAR